MSKACSLRMQPPSSRPPMSSSSTHVSPRYQHTLPIAPNAPALLVRSAASHVCSPNPLPLGLRTTRHTVKASVINSEVAATFVRVVEVEGLLVQDESTQQPPADELGLYTRITPSAAHLPGRRPRPRSSA